MRLFLSSIAAAVAITATGASATTVTTFSDRAAFGAALASASTEDFEAVTGEPDFIHDPLVVGDLTLLITGATTPHGKGYNAIDTRPFVLPVGGDEATFDANAPGDSTLVNVVLRADSADLFSIAFPAPITAFGADLGDFNNGARRTEVAISGGGVDLPKTVPSPSLSGREVIFFGLISGTPFTTVEFSAIAGPDVFSVDNVTYGDASAVPLPAPAALLLGGLAALGVVRRRRR